MLFVVRRVPTVQFPADATRVRTSTFGEWENSDASQPSDQPCGDIPCERIASLKTPRAACAASATDKPEASNRLRNSFQRPAVPCFIDRWRAPNSGVKPIRAARFAITRPPRAEPSTT